MARAMPVARFFAWVAFGPVASAVDGVDEDLEPPVEQRRGEGAVGVEVAVPFEHVDVVIGSQQHDVVPVVRH